MQLVRSDGSVASGARAVFESLDMRKTYESSRVFGWFAEFAYRFIAAPPRLVLSGHAIHFRIPHRTRPIRGHAMDFPAALAVIYAIAFRSLAAQISGLIGRARNFAAARLHGGSRAESGAANRFFVMPTMFWCGLERRDAGGGLLGGRRDVRGAAFGPSRTADADRACSCLYLSLSSAGQEFLGFQWDALLLEAGFLAIFLGRAQIVVWLFRWLVFRLTFFRER